MGFAAFAYVGVYGIALWQHLAGDLADGILCAAPAELAVVLAGTSQTDRRQYVARLFAAMMFLPALLLMWASSHDHADLWLIAFGIGHALGIVAAVVWLASFTTRIDPAAGAMPSGIETLRKRIASLAETIGQQCAMHAARPHEWMLYLREPEAGGRIHRVRLDIDQRRRAVAVREFVSASGAAPRNADEASMRGPGDAWFDPTRPDAEAIWSRTWQSTMLEPAQLARAALQLGRNQIEPPVNGEKLVTLLAVVVTRSGYAWRPRILPGKKR